MSLTTDDHPITPDHEHYYSRLILKLDEVIDQLENAAQLVAPSTTAGSRSGEALAHIRNACLSARAARDFYLASDYDAIRRQATR